MTAKRKNDWQDTDKVLGVFGEKAGPAERAYIAFVETGDGNFVESVLKLTISVPAVSKSAMRGEKLAKARKYSLVG